MNARMLKMTVGVAVMIYAIEYVLNEIAFKSMYAVNHNAGIPWHDMTRNDYLVSVVTVLISSYAFAYIFTRGYEGKGVMEGARFGFWIWLFASVGEVSGFAIGLNFGRRLTLAMMGADLIAFLVAGMVAAALAAQSSTAKAASA